MKTFYKDKKVLVTGHTGFKGSYLCRMLQLMGAEVVGYSLEPPTEPSAFSILELNRYMKDVRGDIRDYASLEKVFAEFRPEIVFHLAAQPIVRTSYRFPLETYETNVMGTVNVCECIRKSDSVKSFLNVTTDKVYENTESGEAFREGMPLDGYEPYSNSKSCSELVTASYRRSFLADQGVAVSTARAGNVIGGGDFAPDRIAPDCFRAMEKGDKIVLRNPYSVRPYQHVLEPLYAYLLIAMKQYENPELSGSYNVGPKESDCLTTGELADIFCEFWGNGASWVDQYDGGPHEAGLLKLNCEKVRNVFSWEPKWSAKEAVQKTVEWYRAYYDGKNMWEITDAQIGEMINV